MEQVARFLTVLGLAHVGIFLPLPIVGLLFSSVTRRARRRIAGSEAPPQSERARKTDRLAMAIVFTAALLGIGGGLLSSPPEKGIKRILCPLISWSCRSSPSPWPRIPAKASSPTPPRRVPPPGRLEPAGRGPQPPTYEQLSGGDSDRLNRSKRQTDRLVIDEPQSADPQGDDAISRCSLS